MSEHLVSRAQRAIRESPDTRALKRELREGNRYALRWLALHGLRWDAEKGAIVSDPLRVEERRTKYGDEDDLELHAFVNDEHAGVLEFALKGPWGEPSPDTALLEFVFVHPEHRREGMASRLAAELVERHGPRRILYGDASPSGRAFAESIGAQRFGRDNKDVREGHYGESCP